MWSALCKCIRPALLSGSQRKPLVRAISSVSNMEKQLKAASRVAGKKQDVWWAYTSIGLISSLRYLSGP